MVGPLNCMMYMMCMYGDDLHIASQGYASDKASSAQVTSSYYDLAAAEILAGSLYFDYKTASKILHMDQKI